MTQSALPPTRTMADDLFVLVQEVAGCVMRRTRMPPSEWGGAVIPTALGLLINLWLMRQRSLILALIARIKSGTQRPPRPYRARSTPADKAASPPRTPPRMRMPSVFSWLTILGQEMKSRGHWLSRLLNDPETKEMVLAHPQLWRRMRPLMRALGERDPEWIPARQTAARRKRVRRARREAGAAAPSAGARADAGPAGELAELVTQSYRKWRESLKPVQPMWNGDTHPPTWIGPPRTPQPSSRTPPQPAVPAQEEWWRRRYRIILASRPAGI